jgi:hypothetical protein
MPMEMLAVTGCMVIISKAGQTRIGSRQRLILAKMAWIVPAAVSTSAVMGMLVTLVHRYPLLPRLMKMSD